MGRAGKRLNGQSRRQYVTTSARCLLLSDMVVLRGLLLGQFSTIRDDRPSVNVLVSSVMALVVRSVDLSPSQLKLIGAASAAHASLISIFSSAGFILTYNRTLVYLYPISSLHHHPYWLSFTLTHSQPWRSNHGGPCPGGSSCGRSICSLQLL